MKKLLLSLAVALGAISMNAQEAGGMWVGGTVGVNHTSVKYQNLKTSGTSFKIMPEFGYILSENFAVGASLGYMHEETLDLKEGKVETDGYVIAPFLRYTFLKGSLGSLFVDTGVAYAYAKGDGLKSTAISGGFTPGLAFAVSDKISLIGKFGFLGYTHTSSGLDRSGVPKIKTNTFGFDLDLSNIQLGAIFTF